MTDLDVICAACEYDGESIVNGEHCGPCRLSFAAAEWLSNYTFKTLKAKKCESMSKKLTINDLMSDGILPQIHAFKDEDDAIIVEWIFSNGIRFGLNIEKDKKESGWHVVSEQITASGPLYVIT